MSSDQQDTTVLAREIGQRLRELAAQARPVLTNEVGDIIAQADRDIQRIERCLDGLLEYCYDDRMLSLFKQLCRYYYLLNPAATAQYVHFYREMWDSSDAELMEW